jgi:hypothetical protein
MLSVVLATLALGGLVVDAAAPAALSFDAKGWYVDPPVGSFPQFVSDRPLGMASTAIGQRSSSSSASLRKSRTPL